jgi:hypothetical protein
MGADCDIGSIAIGLLSANFIINFNQDTWRGGQHDLPHFRPHFH